MPLKSHSENIQEIADLQMKKTKILVSISLNKK